MKENFVVNNKDDRVLKSGTIDVIVAPWKFHVLKTSICELEALLLGQIFVLKTSNFRAATSADSSSFPSRNGPRTEHFIQPRRYERFTVQANQRKASRFRKSKI